jgi:hypothetical protein
LIYLYYSAKKCFFTPISIIPSIVCTKTETFIA